MILKYSQNTIENAESGVITLDFFNESELERAALLK